MEGCSRCNIFIETWEKKINHSNRVSELEGESKVLENMRTLFVRSGCDRMALVCMPILRLIEKDETREENKHLGR